MLPLVLHALNLYKLDGAVPMGASPLTTTNTSNSTNGSIITLGSMVSETSNMSIIEGPFFHKHVAIRFVVGVTCSLSMLGALLIILSYICIRDIRTKSRQVLVHLSIADFGVACANFIGVCVYFDQYIRHCPFETHAGNKTYFKSGANREQLHNGVNTEASCDVLLQLCKAQAFIAAYSTLASVLWTLCLAVYIYCLVFHTNKKVHLRVIYAAYVFCWGMPLFISTWLVVTDQLGYSPQGGSGWCTLKVDDENGKQNIFAVIFGNDLWIYLTFVTVTILYFTVHCHIKFQLKEINPMLLQGSNMVTINKADTKFLLIPFFFLLLRIWTMILVFLLVYIQVDPPRVISYILLYAAGIGDSAQGFVNALLFCVFTPKVREKLILCVRKKASCICCPAHCTPRGGLSKPPSSVDLQTSNSSGFPVLRTKNSNRNSLSGSNDTEYSTLLNK